MNILRFIQRSSFFVGASFLGIVGSAFADPNVDISVSKTASAPQVSAGESITYTLEIENTGSVAIADAVSTVQDFMSNQNIDIASFTITGIDATDSCTITQSDDVLVAILQGQYIECTLGAFTPGEVRTITYTIDTLANVPDGTDIVNTVYVNTDEEEANQKSDNSDSVTVQVNNNTNDPVDVAISKTASQTTAQVGDTVSYTLEYQNLGTGTAENVVIKDIPDREDLDLSTLQFTGFPIGAVCTVTQSDDVLVAILEGQYIECTLNTLTPGQTGQITYSIQVLQNAGVGNMITNTVNISAENETETQGNNTSTSSVEIVASNLQTDLSLTKTVSPSQAQPGETVTYSLTYQNLGTEDAHNVVIIDFSNKDELDLNSLQFHAPLPTGVQCEISQNPDPLVAVFQGNYVQCTLGTVNAGDSGTINYTLDVLDTVNPGSTVLNIATIGSTTTDPNSTNNSPSASLNIVNAGQSDLALTKTTPNTEVVPGATVPYTVTITNTGDITARSIVLKDISAGEKFDLTTLNLSGIDQNNCEVKLDPDLLVAIFQGPHIECSVPDILPGEQVVIDYTITLNSSAVVGDTILNGAQVSSGNETGTLNNNQGTASITVVQDTTPVDGECGTANQAYANGTTTFGTDTFCINGTAPATNPTFPTPGQTVSWTCSALNGGNDASCNASQDIDPNTVIDGECGTANQAYANGTTTFGTDTFCINGTGPSTNPTFPTAGQTISWTCSALNGGNDASCNASQDIDPNAVIDGECGTANQAYANGTTTFGTDTFCINGTAPATNPTFPTAGQTVSWTCSALNGGNDASCNASQDIDPNAVIDGECGTANQAYANGTTTFGTDTFCINGTAPSTNPTFPTPGQTVSWTCSALNGGNDASCNASQGANPTSGNNNGGGTSHSSPVVVSNPSSGSSTSSPNVATSSGSNGSGGGCHSYATIDLKLKAFVQNSSGEYIDAESAEGALILAKNANQTVSYKVILLNSGSVSAYNSEIQIDFASPNGITQSAISNVQGAEYSDGKFKSEAKIPANGSYALTFDATVSSPASGSAKTLFSLVDFAGDYQCPKIESSEGIGENDIVYFVAGDAPIESLPEPVVVVSASTAEAYRISKTADRTEVSPGDEITFTLSIENTGTQDLKNVMLFDIFPNEYLEVVGTSTGNLVDPETLKFKRKFLPQQDTFTVQVKMKVKPHVLDGTVITNVLKAGSQTLEITESSEVNLVVKGAQPDFTPSSLSASVSTPFRLVQTGAELPFIPMGILLIMLGTGIAFSTRRTKS